MKRLFDPSTPLLNPVDLVLTLTKKRKEDLRLPGRAIIAFHTGDIARVLKARKHHIGDSWKAFRSIYSLEGSNTVIARSYFGGPNIAAMVEELSAFGVAEFILWGYCGGIADSANIGDIITVRGALREEGVSYHYINPHIPPLRNGQAGGFSKPDFVYTDWFSAWEEKTRDRGFHEGLVWSCDAIYRETVDKVENYKDIGIFAVEMEAASFYAVCGYRGVKGIAFLVVSDSLKNRRWTPGFHTKPFREGVNRLANFMLEEAIL